MTFNDKMFERLDVEAADVPRLVNNLTKRTFIDFGTSLT